MSLAAFAVRRPIAIAMFFLALVLIGSISLFRMPVSLLPDVAVPRLIVWTAIPDVAPAEVERHVTEPIESALSSVPGVIALESVSSSGQSIVEMRFPWGTDMEFARLHVRERLDNLAEGLPEGAGRPTIVRVDPGAEPILIAAATAVGSSRGGSTWTGPAPAGREVERLAETVFRRRLEQLDGVGRVAVVGGAERLIRVEVDPARLEAHGLSLGDVAAALDQANASAPGGTIRRGRHRYALLALGELASLGDVERVVVRRGENGATVVLADVAAVADTVAERDQAAYLDGEPAIGLVVYKESGANTVAAAKRVEATFAELERDHPGIELTTVTSQAGFITAAIRNVVGALVLGSLLACLVLFPFLGDPRWPGVLALAIPISGVGALVPLHLSGVSLDVMSLGGLALGVGMLVDASIVVLENVFRHREGGAAAEVAAVRGAQEVQGAIAASTLTTIAVFGPIVVVEGAAGALFRELALAVTFSLLVSLLVALTLLPAVAAGLSGGATVEAGTGPGGPGRAFFERGFARTASEYRRLLSRALDRPRGVLAGTATALAVTIMIGLLLPRDILPEVDQRAFTVRLTLGPGTPLERTEAVALGLDRWLRGQPGVEAVQIRVGRASATEAALVGERGPDDAILDVRLGRGGAPTRAVMERLRTAFEHLQPGALRLEAGRATELGTVLGTAEADLAVEVRGSDLEAIRRGARDLAAALERLPALAEVATGGETAHPEIRVSLDRDAVARHGLEPRAVVTALTDRTRGRVATRLVDFDRRVPVLVVAGRDESRSLERALSGSVAGVPLGSLVDVGSGRGPTAIRREGQERIARIMMDVDGGDLAGAIADVRRTIRGTDLPEGVRVRVAGGGAELHRTFRGVAIAFLLALFLIYMILAAQFESFLLPVVVLLAVPLSLIGAVLLLAVTGNGLDTMSLIGIVVLAGIAVNNAILMVDSIGRARAGGMPTRAAIETAGGARLRPIMMTSSTTILGLLPMALGLGSGAELRSPLAVAVIGGMVTSTVLVLIVVPVVYLRIAGRRA
ncbi:MAG TPA: efflux RND transporter permease subunit [Gemmatimonadota bacterium]|nr:efflux RND transporter permease subunit [Gemmatimonadota bacterium]